MSCCWSPVPLCRFDSNASASSSSGDGDSDRDDKKPAKKAKLVKDRKPRKKQPEVRGCWGSGGSDSGEVRVTALRLLPRPLRCHHLAVRCPAGAGVLTPLPPEAEWRWGLSKGRIVPVQSQPLWVLGDLSPAACPFSSWCGCSGWGTR